MPLIIAMMASALCIANVHDGDTVRSCSGERIRIENVDAPEVAGSSRCSAESRGRLAGSSNPAWCDYETGTASRDALRAFLASGPVTIERSGADRYGRTLARLSIRGRDAGAYLISLGLARPWR